MFQISENLQIYLNKSCDPFIPQIAVGISILERPFFFQKKTDSRIVESVNLGAKRCPFFVSSFCHFWGARRNSSIFFVFSSYSPSFPGRARGFSCIVSQSNSEGRRRSRMCTSEALRWASLAFVAVGDSNKSPKPKRDGLLTQNTQLICCTTEPTQLQKPTQVLYNSNIFLLDSDPVKSQCIKTQKRKQSMGTHTHTDWKKEMVKRPGVNMPHVTGGSVCTDLDSSHVTEATTYKTQKNNLVQHDWFHAASQKLRTHSWKRWGRGKMPKEMATGLVKTTNEVWKKIRPPPSLGKDSECRLPVIGLRARRALEKAQSAVNKYSLWGCRALGKARSSLESPLFGKEQCLQNPLEKG